MLHQPGFEFIRSSSYRSSLGDRRPELVLDTVECPDGRQQGLRQQRHATRSSSGSGSDSASESSGIDADKASASVSSETTPITPELVEHRMVIDDSHCRPDQYLGEGGGGGRKVTVKRAGSIGSATHETNSHSSHLDAFDTEFEAGTSDLRRSQSSRSARTNRSRLGRDRACLTSTSPSHLEHTESAPVTSGAVCDSLPTSRSIQLDLQPGRTTFLGQGPLAKVYRARYRIMDDGKVAGDWQVCAAKRMNEAREAQRIGLGEAWILRRLAGGNSLSSTGWEKQEIEPLERKASRHLGMRRVGQHPNIVRLLAVKDEVDWMRMSKAVNKKVSLEALGHGRSNSEIKWSEIENLKAFRDKEDRQSKGEGHMRSMTGQADLVKPSLAEFDPPRLILLLECCSQGDLWSFSERNAKMIDGQLFLKWTRQIASALGYVHASGLIHCDVKPQNALLDDQLNIKLSDFGSALFYDSEQPPTDGLGKGTPAYSAPELFQPRFSPAIDIYSMGATLYVIGIIGKEPYSHLAGRHQYFMIKRGQFWDWHEGQRLLGQFGQDKIGEQGGSGTMDDSSDGLGHDLHSPFFRSGTRIPLAVVDLLRRMVDPDPLQRPSAVEIEAAVDKFVL